MLPDAAQRARDARELARIQRGLQRLISAPDDDARLADSARMIGCDVDGIAVYRGMGEQRFVNEVAREFPATQALLGSTRFDSEARAFARATASASYTLDGYARAFPHQLRRTGRAAGDELVRAAAELARLERELASVRRSRTPRTRSAAPRLAAASGARVRRFAHDVHAALAQLERDGALAAPPRRPSQLALFRRGARVVRLPLGRGEAMLLRALLRGAALEAAVALALGAGLTPDSIGSALECWVREKLLRVA